MKKLSILAVCALAIISCKNDAPKQDLMMTQLRDSLNTIIAQKDTEINDMIATFGAPILPSVSRRTCSSSSRPCVRTRNSSTS